MSEHAHEPDSVTSQDFLTHLIDAASMRKDIEALQRRDNDIATRAFEKMSDLDNSVRVLHELLRDIPRQITVCRTDMRHEIERDFPNKMDIKDMETRIEKQAAETERDLSRQITKLDAKVDKNNADLNTKIEKLWLKITIPIVVVVALGGLAQWILTTMRLASVG
jgi:hypothetical protein